jgi:hypothetical protein
MHEIHEFRVFGTDLVERLNNGTGHLENFFANATEASVGAFIDERMVLIGDTIADVLLFAELQPEPIVAGQHLTEASHWHRAIRELLTPLLRIREAGAELTFQVGSQAAQFLAGDHDDQRPVWSYLDDLLITNSDKLTKARGCMSRLSPPKDAKLRDAIIAIHEIRVALSTMFCEHEEADCAYIAALEVLTGIKQPAPVPSTLTQSHAPTLKAVPSAKKTPPPTLH